MTYDVYIVSLNNINSLLSSFFPFLMSEDLNKNSHMLFTNKNIVKHLLILCKIMIILIFDYN